MEDFHYYNRGQHPEIVPANYAPPARTYSASFQPALRESEIKGPLDYWNLLRRRKLLISTLVLLGAAAGALITLRQIPLYRARTSLEIQTAEQVAVRTAIDGRETNALSDSALQSYLQTQVVILESRSFKKRVSTKLSKEKPHAFYTMDSLSGWQQVFGMSSTPPERKIQTGFPPLDVEVRVVPNTRIIEIAVDSPDPTFSTDFANGMANEFLGYNLEARWEASKRTTEWLTGQLESFKQALRESEDRLQAYRRESGLTVNDREDRSLEQEKLRQIQEELSRAEAARIGIQTEFELAQTTPIDALPEVADNPRLTQYQTRLAELRRQLAELRSDFTPSHPSVKRLEAQITQMETTVDAERSNVLARIGNEFKAAQRRESSLGKAYQSQLGVVSDQASKMVNYSLLKREVDTNRNLYDTLLGKMKEAGITAAASSSDSRIVDVAYPPSKPYKPNIYLNTVGGFMLGFLFSVGVVLLGERLDATFKAPGEIAAHLQLPELGVIPSKGAVAEGRFQKLRRLPGGRRPKDERIELVTWQDSPSLVAESFRNVMASVLMTGTHNQKGRVLLVTSAGRGEGKTTTVANLGIALAEIGQRVLVVDADMRKPRLHSIFDVPSAPGLSDLLRDTTPIADLGLEPFLKETRIKGLHALASGSSPVSVSKLLYSRRVAEMLGRLEQEFDIVLIDTPPLLSMSDARVLGQLSQGTILVVRAGQTPRDLALAARQRLTEDGIPLLGTILVAWDGKSRARYGLEHYFSSYYSRTGAGGV